MARRRVVLGLALWLILCLSAAPALASDVTVRVSVSSAGEQGSDASDRPAISADGRYVAFASEASNLVPGDTNASFDVFVHDRSTGATERVSVSSAGEQANSTPYRSPAITADGRYVAFVSGANNLVTGDTNGLQDVFVHDRISAVTERVSVSSLGEESNGVSEEPATSSDGRYVTFHSFATNLVAGDTNGFRDVFVHDRVTAVTERVSVSSTGEQSNGFSYWPSISADGRYVVFSSWATNLVPGDTTDEGPDVFVHDRVTAATERVSVSSAGEQANSWTGDSTSAVSADGRYVVFWSEATNLVPDDTNGYWDVFIRDRVEGTTELVSVSSGGEQGNNYSFGAAISADGRYVGFCSCASNLVPMGTSADHPDVFVHDRVTGVTEQVSVSSAGEQGDYCSYYPTFTADGRYVAFTSWASNLVPGDTNACTDIFVRGPADATLEVGEVGASPSDTATVPVSLTQTAGIAGIQFDLEYLPPVGALEVHLTAARAVGPTMGWAVDSMELVPGERGRVIAYSLASEELPSGSGVVLEVDFLVDASATIGDSYVLHPIEVVLSDGAGESLRSVGSADGRLNIEGIIVPPDYFSFEPIASPQGADTSCPRPVSARIEARYAGGALAASYQDSADLSTSSGGAVLEPASVTFSRGVWEGSVSIITDEGLAACTLVVSDQAEPGITGESNPFALRVKGDPTDDGEVNVLDVLRTVSITLEREIPEPPGLEFQGWAADMNCSEEVNVQDIVLVVQKSLGLSGPGAVPFQQVGWAGSGLLLTSEEARTVSVQPSSTTVHPEDTFTLEVSLDEAVGVAGFQFDLTWEPEVVELADPVRAGSLLAGGGWALQSNQVSENRIRVLAYSVAAHELPEGSGSLVELDFNARALGGSSVSLDSVVLSSGLGTGLPSVGVGGSVAVILFSDAYPDHWAFQEIAACHEANIVQGYPDGTYRPEWTVTRDQMAVYIARGLEAPSGEAVLADWVPADPRDFPDVPSDHWAYTHIEYCVENGVVEGYEDGSYHPEYEVTRDQMAVYVARALVAPEGEAGLADYVPADPRNFPDAASDFWAYTHIEYCVEHGVVQGYEDGLYHPEIVVTRDQMAVYVARAFGLVL
jgi:Tol biopolymer transport system component